MPTSTDSIKQAIAGWAGDAEIARLTALMPRDHRTDRIRQRLWQPASWKRIDKRQGPDTTVVRVFAFADYPTQIFLEVVEGTSGALTHRFLATPLQIAAIKTPRYCTSSEFLAGPGDEDLIVALQDAMMDAGLIEGAENLSTPTAWEITGAAGSFLVILVRDGGDWEDPAVCFYRTDTRAAYLPPQSAQKTLAAAWNWFEGTPDPKRRDMLTTWVMRALADDAVWTALGSDV